MTRELADIATNIEQRIADIDRQLAEMEVLRQEREHLDRALQEVTAVASGQARGPRRSATPARAGGGSGHHRTGRASGGGRKRAPQGKNRERIVTFLRGDGPSSASAIAGATGIHRGVVYANLGKLVEEGAVRKIDRDGGTSVFELTAG